MEAEVKPAELRDKIDTTLGTAKGEPINICYALLKLIEKASEQDQPSLFRYTAERYGVGESSKELPVEAFISENEEKDLRMKYGQVIDKMLAALEVTIHQRSNSIRTCGSQR